MLKIFAVSLFAMVACAGAANARGGGGAETMPSFGYTDLPPYHPLLACRTKRSCAYPRRHPRVYDYWTPRY
jgi:hypothetical protein